MSSNKVRLIDANALIDSWNKVIKHMVRDSDGASPIDFALVISDVSKAPTIDPESLRPHGKWEWLGPYRGNNEGYIGTCPVCKKRMRLFELNYCPNCGANMEG